MGDQGRLALIASAETTALVKTPESSSQDNGLLETREFTLTDNGPANVVEITQPKGMFESGFRSFYADKPDKDTRDGLRGYVKSEYLSDDLTKVDRTDPADLSLPFELTIGCEKAKRGYTGLENAQAAIRVDRLFQLLPDELKRKDDTRREKGRRTRQAEKAAHRGLGAECGLQHRVELPHCAAGRICSQGTAQGRDHPARSRAADREVLRRKERRGDGASCLRFREAPLHRRRGNRAAQSSGRAHRRPRDSGQLRAARRGAAARRQGG